MREADKVLTKKLGQEANKYPSLNNNIVERHKVFAENSQFHGEIMEDGYVFNPYIHRRWLPSQYERMINNHLYNLGATKENFNMANVLSHYKKGYATNYVIEELNKLALLSRFDRVAYEERSKFFTVDIIKHELIEYFEDLLEEAKRYSASLSFFYPSFYTGSHGYFILSIDEREEEIDLVKKSSYFDGTMQYVSKKKYSCSTFLIKLETIIDQLKRVNSYYGISKIIAPFKHRYIWEKRGLSDEFIEAFWKAGAYYSIKNKIMFSNKPFNGISGAFAYKELRKVLENGATAAELHAMYITMN